MASSSLSSSTAFYYRQKEPASIKMFHETPPFINVSVEPGLVNQPEVTTLCKLVKEKNLHSLADLGGVEGIKTCLQSDGQRGIWVGDDLEEISLRKKTYGSNYYGGPPPKSFFCFLLSKPFKDAPMIVIMIFAILSIGFGIKKHGLGPGWYDNDGGSVVVSLIVVISVTAIGDFMQYKQFRQLAEIRNNFSVEVVRNGRRQSISICGVVVGDVVFLKIGDEVPADGIFVEGHSLVVDESCVTGQSIRIEVNRDRNPFLLSGSKVVHGCAKMMVTCVGTKTLRGEIMMRTINRDSNQEEQTPLQIRLHELATCVDIFGKAVALLVLVVLLLRYFTGNMKDENGYKAFNGSKTKADDIINAVAGIIVAATTILVVATPEGLPSIVALTPAFCMKRTMSDQAALRKLRASEIMGSATRICMDMTSILRPNQMSVTVSFVGRESLEGRSYTSIAVNVRRLLVQGIGLISDCSRNLFTITSVDDAIHNWAVRKLNLEMEQSTNGLSILHVDASCLERKRIGVLAKEDADNMVHVHWRGDFERIFSVCSHYYGINGDLILLDDEERENFRQTIEMMAAGGLHCIAFAHKHLSQEEYDQINEQTPSNDLILLGVVGVKRLCHPGVKKAIEICQLANVKVIMITSENVSTANAIATECGVISHFPEAHDAGSTTVAGRQFRSLSDEEQMGIVERINIMARSSPVDKHLLVQRLRSANQVVAVTGDAGGDIPALRDADIGLAMGIKGTQSVKENSDIVILDDNFASVATILRTGRCVRRNVEKLIQFQIPAILAALVITVVTVVLSGKTLMTPAQFLWFNLTTNALGLLALAAEKPSERLMYEPPRGRSDPLITNIMWRNIMCQALYQITTILALEFKGKSIFATNENVNDTLVFNTFILCQVFNRFNARKLEEINIFKGILKNKIFLGVTGITIILQVIMVEFLNKLAHTERLDWIQWGVCTGIAAFSWLIGLIAKFVPVS